jgi:hypothetical protein
MFHTNLPSAFAALSSCSTPPPPVLRLARFLLHVPKLITSRRSRQSTRPLFRSWVRQYHILILFSRCRVALAQNESFWTFYHSFRVRSAIICCIAERKPRVPLHLLASIVKR